MEISFKHLVQIALQRDLAQQFLTCQGDFAHDLLQRSSQRVRALAKSNLVSLPHVLCNAVWGLLPG